MNVEVWEVRMSASQGPADSDVSGERRHLHSAWGKGVGAREVLKEDSSEILTTLTNPRCAQKVA